MTLLGVVFLFVLAVNRGWIGPAERVLAGALVSGLLVAAGVVARRRYGQLDAALAAVGAGLAGGYATLLAATARYDLVDHAGALLLAAAIAAVGTAIALAWSAEILAGIGLVGAALAPAAVGIEGGIEVLGTAFAALVFAAIAVVGLRRGWTWLLVAGVAATAPQWLALLVAEQDEPPGGAVAVAVAARGALPRDRGRASPRGEADRRALERSRRPVGIARRPLGGGAPRRSRPLAARPRAAVRGARRRSLRSRPRPFRAARRGCDGRQRARLRRPARRPRPHGRVGAPGGGLRLARRDGPRAALRGGVARVSRAGGRARRRGRGAARPTCTRPARSGCGDPGAARRRRRGGARRVARAPAGPLPRPAVARDGCSPTSWACASWWARVAASVAGLAVVGAASAATLALVEAAGVEPAFDWGRVAVLCLWSAIGAALYAGGAWVGSRALAVAGAVWLAVTALDALAFDLVELGRRRPGGPRPRSPPACSPAVTAPSSHR